MIRKIEAALLSNNTIEVQQLPDSYLLVLGDFPSITLVQILVACHLPSWLRQPSQRSLHNAPIFRLLLKVAVKGTHQCDFTNFWGSLGIQHMQWFECIVWHNTIPYLRVGMMETEWQDFPSITLLQIVILRQCATAWALHTFSPACRTLTICFMA